MTKDINLLYSKKQLRLNQLTQEVRILRFIALGVLFLTVVSSMVFFLLVIASPLPALKRQEDELTAELSKSHEEILKQTLLSLRLADISAITNKRSDYGAVLAAVRSKLPENTEVTTFQVEKKSAIVVVTTTNLENIETYFARLKNLVDAKQTISKAYLTSLDAKQTLTNQISSFDATLYLELL